jgi:hypothetical protein
LAFAFLLDLSFAMAGLVLGAWLLQRFFQPQPRVPEAAFFGLGLLVLILLGLLPWVGALINLLALIYGAGAVLLLPRTRQPEPAVTRLAEEPLTVTAAADGEVVGPRAA